jgi:hypothetical protein
MTTILSEPVALPDEPVIGDSESASESSSETSGSVEAPKAISCRFVSRA